MARWTRISRLRRRTLTGYGWPAVLERIERVIDETGHGG